MNEIKIIKDTDEVALAARASSFYKDGYRVAGMTHCYLEGKATFALVLQKPPVKVKKETKDTVLGEDSYKRYSEEFEDFWSSWKDFGPKGSKHNACVVWRKLMKRPSMAALGDILQAQYAQQLEKTRQVNEGKEPANFKHVERWLRGKEWENDLETKPVAKKEYL